MPHLNVFLNLNIGNHCDLLENFVLLAIIFCRLIEITETRWITPSETDPKLGGGPPSLLEQAPSLLPLPKQHLKHLSSTQHEDQAMLSDKWIQHQRKQNRQPPQQWTCHLCSVQTVFSNTEALWSHCQVEHEIPVDEVAQEIFRKSFIEASSSKPNRDTPRRPFIPNDNKNLQPEPSFQPPRKHDLPTQTISAIKALRICSPVERSDVPKLNDQSDERVLEEAARGERISCTGPVSPQKDVDSSSPRRVKARPISDIKLETAAPRRSVGNTKTIWVEGDIAPTRSSVDHSNIASVAIAKKRNQQLQSSSRPVLQLPPQTSGLKSRTPSAPITRELFRPSNTRNLESRRYRIVLQPAMTPLTNQQLVAEVKRIYEGLITVEARCIEADKKQATLAQETLIDQSESISHPKLNQEKLQTLIDLHRSLLHEHYDFLLFSQHPSASASLRSLASTYVMPSRMWYHAIYSFLEVLRHLLPASLDHLLAFLYSSYSMLTLLYETVSTFEDTWIEYLGDLGRYRMAIENDSMKDQHVWADVARYWYIKALEKNPGEGRFYHNLAILVRSRELQRLFYYSKSLCVSTPFPHARRSISALLNLVLPPDKERKSIPNFDIQVAFVALHGMLSTNRDIEMFDSVFTLFADSLKNCKKNIPFLEQACFVAVINCVAMLDYGSKSSEIMRLILQSNETPGVDMPMTFMGLQQSSSSLELIQRLNNLLFMDAINRMEESEMKDSSALIFVHVILVFVMRLTRHSGAMSLIRLCIPWDSFSETLNNLLNHPSRTDGVFEDSFPFPLGSDSEPFPEDYVLRGLVWAADYFPDIWFKNDKRDKEKRDKENQTEMCPSLSHQRCERILWIARQIGDSLETPLVFRDRFSTVKDVIQAFGYSTPPKPESRNRNDM